LKEKFDSDTLKSYKEFTDIFSLADNKTTRKWFKKLSDDNKSINVKQALHVILNNTNLHHEEKFKFLFLLYSRTKNYISSKDLENILKINLKVKSKVKENLKKINEAYNEISTDLNIDLEYEFETLLSIYRTYINLFI
jgi:glycine cleavage system regulatory protein